MLSDVLKTLVDNYEDYDAGQLFNIGKQLDDCDFDYLNTYHPDILAKLSEVTQLLEYTSE